ncbi:hypothetical protein IT412_00020 [Candidatus Peregrinibacteria bacterium]|nr:hypothetical protein [Candidatus Peregrinibacteria bacterium]
MIAKKNSALVAVLLLATMALAACGETTTTPQKVENDTTKQPVVETPKNEAPKVEVKVDNVIKDEQVDFKKAEKLDAGKVLVKYKKDLTAAYIDYYNSDKQLDFDKDLAGSFGFYDVGTLKVAPYKGQKLLVMNLECDGPCMSATIERFAWDEKTGDITWLENLSNTDFIPDYFKVLQAKTDSKLTLEALDLPKSVILPDGKNSMQLKDWGSDIYKADLKAADENAYNYIDLGKVAFHDEKLGDVYFSAGAAGCLYVVGPDSVIATYAYDPGLTIADNAVTISWSNGAEKAWIADDYSAMAHGCGIGASCYFVEEMTDADVSEIGKTNGGMKIYAAKDSKLIENLASVDYQAMSKTAPGRVALTETYNSYVDMFQYMEESTRGDRVKTYDEFMRMNPIIYWKDPFGRYSALIRNEVKPPAECGKPVIYLYPEKTTEVSVKVGIDEFTKTEPAYGDDGWKVIAQPNGELTNLADGQKYEYLFWEGISKEQLEMNGGFVVAKTDLENFLNDSLAKLGLNEKEAADFKEFWLPKMKDSAGSYVLVSFVGTTDFNKIAPLTISPKPDTLIRVFMYYQPLMNKIDVPTQKLSKIERNGFTVIEWGGTSSEGWQLK